MRLASSLLFLALAAILIPASSAFQSTPAPGDSSVPEIRIIGEPAPKPRSPLPSAERAVTRFLAARQDASIDRSLAARVRRSMPGGRAEDELLAGPRGSTLVAFDFDASALPVEGTRPARFEASVTLLFANADRLVVESREETLTFAAAEGGFACTKILPTNVIGWDYKEALARASSSGLGNVVERLKSHFDTAVERGRMTAFSLSDVEAGTDDRVAVSCLRYAALYGRPGFEVEPVSVVFARVDGAFRIEPN